MLFTRCLPLGQPQCFRNTGDLHSDLHRVVYYTHSRIISDAVRDGRKHGACGDRLYMAFASPGDWLHELIIKRCYRMSVVVDITGSDGLSTGELKRIPRSGQARVKKENRLMVSLTHAQSVEGDPLRSLDLPDRPASSLPCTSVRSSWREDGGSPPSVGPLQPYATSSRLITFTPHWAYNITGRGICCTQN